MRTLVGALVTVLACAACTGGPGGSDAAPTPSASTETSVTLASLDLGWPKAQGVLDPVDPPEVPDGFDAATFDRMAQTLSDWGRATTVDEQVWHGDEPVDDVADVLPEQTASTLRAQTQEQVSPRLAVANVFADDVTIVGSPQVTTAWRVSQDEDDDGRAFVLLELQTRAAYEVRLGPGGPTRVIGVLRVHGLSAFAGTSDDFGVSGGWQEFGAGDCALALDDELVPDTDLAGATSDLERFVEVGDGPDVVMPELGDDEQVDADYLQRCRAGRT